MGDRRPKERAEPAPVAEAAGAAMFAECGLNAADFDVQSGGGKSFLSKQRLVWMTVKHVPSGRMVSGKIGTTKKVADRQHDALLRSLLRSFRRQ